MCCISIFIIIGKFPFLLPSVIHLENALLNEKGNDELWLELSTYLRVPSTTCLCCCVRMESMPIASAPVRVSLQNFRETYKLNPKNQITFISIKPLFITLGSYVQHEC